jgi:ketopantoate reductase
MAADGGIDLGRRVLAEVSSIAAADGFPLTEAARTELAAMLTDQSSAFGPSMFRDMRAGRPIEITVLGASPSGHAHTSSIHCRRRLDGRDRRPQPPRRHIVEYSFAA